MEFMIQRSTLLSAIRKTIGIVERKTTMPILSTMLIRTEERGVTVIATDLEITLIAQYEADIVNPGEVAVSAKKVYDIIRETPDGVIRVQSLGGNVVVLSYMKSVYNIHGLSPEDYPKIADDTQVVFHRMDRKVLIDLITKSSFAVSTDETRSNLTGAFLEVEKNDGSGMIRMVATDGHRMAIVEYPIEVEDVLLLEKGVIIPRKGLTEMRKLVEEHAGDVFLSIHQNMCIVKISDVVLKVRLIDAEYPDYRRVIPSERGTVLSGDKETIIRALRRMNVISSEGYGGVIVSVREHAMVLTSSEPDVGEGREEIGVEYTGDELRVGYNVGYLLSALEVIDQNEIRWEINLGTKPTILTGKDSPGYKGIVMPLILK